MGFAELHHYSAALLDDNFVLELFLPIQCLGLLVLRTARYRQEFENLRLLI